jgi:hypothetical protein
MNPSEQCAIGCGPEVGDLVLIGFSSRNNLATGPIRQVIPTKLGELRKVRGHDAFLLCLEFNHYPELSRKIWFVGDGFREPQNTLLSRQDFAVLKTPFH